MQKGSPLSNNSTLGIDASSNNNSIGLVGGNSISMVDGLGREIAL